MVISKATVALHIAILPLSYLLSRVRTLAHRGCCSSTNASQYMIDPLQQTLAVPNVGTTNMQRKLEGWHTTKRGQTVQIIFF